MNDSVNDNNFVRNNVQKKKNRPLICSDSECNVVYNK